MKFIYIILALMFVLFAAVQYNDPDPWLWIFIYGTMAATCLYAAWRKPDIRLMLLMIAALAIYSVTFLSGVSVWLQQEDQSALFDEIQKMQHPYIEESREFLGLLICIAVLILIALVPKPRKKSI